AYPYPFTLPGVLRIKRHTTTGNDNVTTFSSVFYDWRVSRTACVSAVDTLSVDIVPVPALVMPNDTILCDAASFTIQPQNTAGAVNLWETGDTTLTLTVTAPGTYSLQSYLNPQCPAFDSIRVEFEQIPQFAGLSDTVLCEPGFITLQAQHSGDVVAWYRDPAATQLISASTALVQPLADTAFYVRSYNTLSAGAVGIPDDQTFATGSFTSIQTGYVFDALTDLVIDSVAVYVSIASTELIIELWNAANVPIQRVVRKPGKLGKAFIPLTFLVPAGNDYKLMLRPVVTGSIYRNGNSPYPYPFALPGIIRIKRHTTDGSNTITTFSSVFYDWRVSRIACESPVETKGVQVSIPYVLPDSLYSCEPFTLSTQLPQFAYAWRPLTDAGPGPVISQSAAVQIDSSGLYLLRMEDAGGCVLEDTVEVDIPTTAGLPADGVLCGNFLTTNYGDEAEFLWSTGETASAIFIDTPGLYWVAVSEPRGCNLTDTIAVSGFSPFPDVNLGSDITACDSVLLDPQLPGNSYLWSTGSTAPALTVQSSGTYAVTVTNAFGCAASDTIGVFVLLTPSADLFYSVSGQLVSFSIDLNTLAGVLWIFGDGTSSNEFNPEHFYDAPGTYTVQLIVSNFCGSDTVTETVVIRSTTAVDPDAEAGLQVYPNPAQGQIQLETGLPAGTPYQLEVLDPLGRVLLATSGHAEPGARTLRLEPWPEGLYQLRLTARGQVSSRAFRLIR
ncbi:MAG: PKD domain-containing protein, partial [Bacteroidia bacterium]|nr:PKD domain-containing protein [Bacteroidia bacterium]